MNERQKRRGQFVVSSGDVPEMFDSREDSLDEISTFIAVFVEFPLNAAVAPGSDDGFNIRGVQIDEDGIAVTGFVGANRAGLQITQEWQCFGAVACLTADYVESLRRKSALR